MCQVNITKYSGCGCEIYEVVSRCSKGDGSGHCSGNQRYERAVRDGVCGRSHCAYYANPKPQSRWAGNKSTGNDSLSKMPTSSKSNQQEASTRDGGQGIEKPRSRVPGSRGPMSHNPERSLEHQF